MSDPYLVIGLPGSGIAELAQALALCGVQMDDTVIPEISQRLVQSLKGQWYDMPQFAPEWMQTAGVQILRQEALAAQPNTQNKSWGWVDTNAAFTLEFWRSLFPRMKIVVCVRRPVEQAPELLSQRRHLRFDDALTLWKHYYRCLQPYADQVVVTHYDSYRMNATAELERVCHLLDIPCSLAARTSADAIFKPSTDYSLQASSETSEVYDIWAAHAGDIFQSLVSVPGYQAEQVAQYWQALQGERAILLEQITLLQHEVGVLENDLNKLSDVLLVVLDGRLRRMKHRLKNYVLKTIAVLKPSEPLLTAVELPAISIVTVLNSRNRDDPKALKDTIQSVVSQTSSSWQWVVMCQEPPDHLVQFSKRDSRIQLYQASPQQTIIEQWNAALNKTANPYVMFLYPGDRLAEAALAEVGAVLQEQPDTDAIYSDVTFSASSKNRGTPFFKPDWSPAMMFSVNLMEGLFVFKREWIKQAGDLDSEMGEGAYWDFCWRITEKARRIHHIPAVLYYGVGVVETSSQVQGKIQKAHLLRRGFTPQGTLPPRWEVSPTPTVSIIIPSRDKADLLETCLSSLFTLTDYPNYEVLIVDTGSVEPATYALYRKYQAEQRFKLIHYPKMAFNFSKACNLGVAHARGDLLLFLNNDTEILQPDWMSLMAQWFSNPEVGIVGPKLIYPNGTIQHAGVILGLSGLANHIMQTQAENSRTIFGSDGWYRNFLAVTGACLMISRAIFTEVRGFNEEYQLNFSDVELCLRVAQRGYQTIYTPDVRLTHHEAQTHKYNIPYRDFEYASRDFRHWLIHGDPFFNPNLSYTNTQPRKNRHRFKTPYPNHTMAMKRIRMLANR